MAATNYTPIQLYYSTTASAAPTAGNLVNGELAINITDGKLYYKDNGGVVQVIATKGAGTIGGSNTQIQFNDGGSLAGNAAMVFNKTTNVTTLTTLNLTNALGATYGGTAQSAYAQGDLLYASAVNTLSKLSIGTVNYILTSTGSVPQWVAPSSVTVQTANNLAGGAAGSVPYQSAADTTTFLAIGAANRVMTSTGSAPQWVTSLTGLTGVSSSSITNTALTSGRLVYSGASGVQTDSSNLTFDGTTLSATGFSTTGASTLVKLVKIGDSAFTTSAVLAAATPAKLYVGTGAVTDGSSAGGATNTLGTITAFGQTQVIATNANVTYTNLATLYIAGAPTAGTNVTITNPYSLYIAGGASYLGGATTFNSTTQFNGVATHSANVLFSADNTYDLGASGATRPRTGYFGTSVVAPTFVMSGLTSGRVVYTTTSGQLTDSANLLYSGTDLTVYGVTVGRGAGAVSTNTAVGASALAGANTGTGYNNAFGTNALQSNTSGIYNSAFGYALVANTTGNRNTAIGVNSTIANTTGSNNTAVGVDSLQANTTASNNTAVGYQAGYSNTTGTQNVAIGDSAFISNTTGSYNTAIGRQALAVNTTASNNTAVGYQAAYNNTASYITAVGAGALYANTTGASNSALGLNALNSNTTGGNNTALGRDALVSNTTASNNTAVGYQSLYTNTGGNSTAVGYQALKANTTGGSEAFGYQALGANTTGVSNNAFGLLTLSSNTTGSYNTAFGQQALISNTTASNNTAVGYQAGYSTTTGNMTAFGYQAGYAMTTGAGTFIGNTAGRNVTGSYNTAVGIETGRDTGTGSWNTSMGHAALRAMSGGNNNVAIGGSALQNGSGAFSDNIAVGYAALIANTGNSNIGIGTYALTSNTTASNNTAVGYQAGYSITAGGSSTLIGYQAGYALTINGTNTFVGYQSGNAVTTGYYNTILGSYSGNQGGLDIRTANNYIVLSDGQGNPWWSLNGNTGVESLRQYGQNNITPVMKVSGFGYAPGSYRAIVLGGQTLAGTYNTLCLGYDPAGNTSGSYSGTGGEIFVQNGTSINQPNSANTTFQSLMVFETNGSGVRFSQNIGIGGTSPTASGTGITFPATQSASSDANTLDDYEEGTWTPVFTTDGTAPTYTATSVQGSYTKIGNVVFVTFYIYSSGGATGGTGNVRVTGMPFGASASGGQAYNRILPSYLYWGGANKWSADGRNGLGWHASTTYIDLYAASATYANGAFEVGGAGFYYV